MSGAGTCSLLSNPAASIFGYALPNWEDLYLDQEWARLALPIHSFYSGGPPSVELGTKKPSTGFFCHT